MSNSNGIDYKGGERKLLDVLDSDAVNVNYISFKHASIIESNQSSVFLNGTTVLIRK